jgi:hypothetical protein
MRIPISLLLALPLVAQAPARQIAVPTGNGDVVMVPDLYDVVDYAEVPVRAAFRAPQDFPRPSQLTASTWQTESEHQALAEVVELAEGGRHAAEVIAGPITRDQWPHQDIARAWVRVSGEARSRGESIYTAQERWARWYWDWWVASAKVRAPGVDVEKEADVRPKYGDPAPITRWRNDLMQRLVEWRRADVDTVHGRTPAHPMPLLRDIERTIMARLKGGK